MNGYDQFFRQAKKNSGHGQQAKGQGPRGKGLGPTAVGHRPSPVGRRPDAAEFKVSPDKMEQKLRQAVKVTKTKAPFPWAAVGVLAVCLFAAGFYVTYPQKVERLLGRIEIGAFGQAEAADKEEKKPAEKSAAKPAKGEKAADAKTADAKAKGPEEKSGSAEDVSHFEKLKQRKEELDLREKELTELEEELQKQKVELDKRIMQLEEMRNHIAQTLKDRVDVDQEKVNKLVDLYSNMKPKQAADIIGSLNEELAVEVLAKMKKKSAAEIMNLLPPEKARVLSEKYTGYRRVSSIAEPKG